MIIPKATRAMTKWINLNLEIVFVLEIFFFFRILSVLNLITLSFGVVRAESNENTNMPSDI